MRAFLAPEVTMTTWVGFPDQAWHVMEQFKLSVNPIRLRRLDRLSHDNKPNG
jgi:hypothetical protein